MPASTIVAIPVSENRVICMDVFPALGGKGYLNQAPPVALS
jgi:hypothetical protein